MYNLYRTFVWFMFFCVVWDHTVCPWCCCKQDPHYSCAHLKLNSNCLFSYLVPLKSWGKSKSENSVKHLFSTNNQDQFWPSIIRLTNQVTRASNVHVILDFINSPIFSWTAFHFRVILCQLCSTKAQGFITILYWNILELKALSFFLCTPWDQGRPSSTLYLWALRWLVWPVWVVQI